MKESTEQMIRRVNHSSLPDRKLVELIEEQGGDPSEPETVKDFADMWDFHGG